MCPHLIKSAENTDVWLQQRHFSIFIQLLDFDHLNMQKLDEFKLSVQLKI